ncbi:MULTISPECIES: hypothetical protein [unclassified Coleofasciculus]|uniref:hypothetical protein n=1 Tax=unclassified Coleofasciculus TaxID=2692782 RepID=UPI00188134B8|nr:MULTISPECIES: hypothetical protein [unclassified Coleofasciculus]MBE9125365.1 hypothetical protein [Coleofasciculus sp. LEGE 07081]MBE9147418.1 hypothetical protein [Coleofasciculus sp. LEGE 07092]
MFDWVWLARVTLMGLVGTATGATLLVWTLGKTPLINTNSNPSPVANVTPGQPQPVLLPPQPLVLTTQSNPVSLVEGATTVLNGPFDLKKTLSSLTPLFATPTSLGMVAIGVAEGNYRLLVENGNLYVQQTASYFGHTDPGNLSWGDVVTNYGPCSDQGRSGGDITQAEQLCLQRSRSRLSTHLVDLNAVGIDPSADIEALLNAADLYNQAKPIHSRFFPKALAMARKGGLTGIEAIAWARTASFYLNLNNEMDLQGGLNQATGLIGICARENRPITEWDCVYSDQMRRVKAIASVLDKYRLTYAPSS